MAPLVCSGAWRQREGLLAGCHMQLKSRVCYLRRTRADFKDSQQSLPLVHSFGDLGEWEWSKLFVQFSIALAFLIELYLAFARQEGIFLYVFVSFVAAYKTLFSSVTVHQIRSDQSLSRVRLFATP